MKAFIKSLFRIENYFDLAKHVAMMLVITILLVIFIFYVFMPIYTHHGESITVPDIIGLSYEDLDKFLTERNLRY